MRVEPPRQFKWRVETSLFKSVQRTCTVLNIFIHLFFVYTVLLLGHKAIKSITGHTHAAISTSSLNCMFFGLRVVTSMLYVNHNSFKYEQNINVYLNKCVKQNFFYRDFRQTILSLPGDKIYGYLTWWSLLCQSPILWEPVLHFSSLGHNPQPIHSLPPVIHHLLSLFCSMWEQLLNYTFCCPIVQYVTTLQFNLVSKSDRPNCWLSWLVEQTNEFKVVCMWPIITN